MTFDQNSDVSARITRAKDDVLDLSQGAGEASTRLQADVWQSKRDLNAQQYDQFMSGVTELKDLPQFAVLSAAWARSNIKKFDTDGDNRLGKDEIETAIQRTDNMLDRVMLSSVHEHYKAIKDAQGYPAFGIRKDSLKTDDFDTFIKFNEMRIANDIKTKSLVETLLRKDGGSENPLFATLDTMKKGGDKDGNISIKDLRSFVQEYDRASASGTGDKGVFTRENRDYVQYLVDHWLSRDVVDMRGLMRIGRAHRRIPRPYITEKSLQSAMRPLDIDGYP